MARNLDDSYKQVLYVRIYVRIVRLRVARIIQGQKRVGVVRKLGCSRFGASAGLRLGCGGELRLRWVARVGFQGL